MLIYELKYTTVAHTTLFVSHTSISMHAIIIHNCPKCPLLFTLLIFVYKHIALSKIVNAVAMLSIYIISSTATKIKNI